MRASPHHEVVHELTQRMKMEYVVQPLVLGRVRHSRMLLAGIQAEFGPDRRLKHSGVTVLGVASLDPSRNFRRRHEGHEGFRRVCFAHRRSRGNGGMPTSAVRKRTLRCRIQFTDDFLGGLLAGAHAIGDPDAVVGAAGESQRGKLA
jgi:hypothetical protein